MLPEGAEAGGADEGMSNLVDTLLNLVVFAFIGLLIWLYLKPLDRGSGDSDHREDC